MDLNKLVCFLDELLSVDTYADYAINGLQVEGRSIVKKIITGVSANQALFNQAIAKEADLILVHHGLFWNKADNRPIQLMRQRLDILFRHNVSLVAYHLPLDFHLVYGNNIQFAKILGVDFERTHYDKMTKLILFLGELDKKMTGDDLSTRLTKRLHRKPFYIPGRTKTIRKIAWCVGGAQSGLYAAVKAGVDAYITGEVSEPVVSIAHETGIHFFAAGHHATEMFGVQALGEHLASKFNLAHQFIDITNPV